MSNIANPAEMLELIKRRGSIYLLAQVGARPDGNHYPEYLRVDKGDIRAMVARHGSKVEYAWFEVKGDLYISAPGRGHQL